jgi:uncharacterized protein YjaZ
VNVVIAHDIDGDAAGVIRSICATTEPEVRALLPMLAAELTLTVSTSAYVIPETGEVGASVAPGQIRWMVRPDDVAGIAQRSLRFSLFHELHHNARGWCLNDPSPFERFVHAAIAEGMATAFERDAAGSAPLWGEYPDDVDRWVEELLALPITADYGHWIFQHPDGRRWIGYRAGTYITDRAMQASGRTAAELVNVPGDEVLALAGLT